MSTTEAQGTPAHATGTFDVTIKPAEPSELGRDAGLGRMTIDKVWTGGIQGTSKGEMTSSNVDGAMAYVALEKVTGTVAGRSGSFYFVHRATMTAGDAASAVLDVTVVPNSGTGELKGLTGTLQIRIDKGAHSYDFAYALPSAGH